MNISDLEVLEVVRDEKVEGGIAIANADSIASAFGYNFAGTSTSTYTSAYSSYYYNSASSSSSSNSTAA
jgi:hypothetical protein